MLSKLYNKFMKEDPNLNKQENQLESEVSLESKEIEDVSKPHVELKMQELFQQYLTINEDNSIVLKNEKNKDDFYAFWERIDNLDLKELPAFISMLLKSGSDDAVPLALKVLNDNEILKDNAPALGEIFLDIFKINPRMAMENLDNHFSILSSDVDFQREFVKKYLKRDHVDLFYANIHSFEAIKNNISLQGETFLHFHSLHARSAIMHFDRFKGLQDNVEFQLRFVKEHLEKEEVKNFLKMINQFHAIFSSDEIQEQVFWHCFDLNPNAVTDKIESFGFFDGDNALSRKILYKAVSSSNVLVPHIKRIMKRMHFKDEEIARNSDIQEIVDDLYVSDFFEDLVEEIKSATEEGDLVELEELQIKYEKGKESGMKAFEEALLQGKWSQAMDISKIADIRDRFSKYGKEEISKLIAKRKSEGHDFSKRNYWKSQFVKDELVDKDEIKTLEEKEKRMIEILEKLVGIKNIKPSDISLKSFDIFYQSDEDKNNVDFILSVLQSGQTISENCLSILNQLFEKEDSETVNKKLENFIQEVVKNSEDLDEKVLNELLVAKESNKIPERMKTIINEFIRRGFRGLSEKTLAVMYSIETDVEREDQFEEWEKIVDLINSGQEIPEEIKKHELYAELVYTAYQPEEMSVDEVRDILKSPDYKSYQEHFKKWEYPGKNSDPSIIKMGSLTSPEDKEKEILDLIEKSDSEDEIEKLEKNLKSVTEKKKKWKKMFPKIQKSIGESFEMFLKMSEIGLEELDDSRFKKIITNAAVKSGKFEKPENKEYLMRYYFSRPENKDLIKKIKKLKKDFENDSSNLEDLYHYISEIELIYRDIESAIREPAKEKVLETQEKICEKLRESIKDTFIQFEGNIGPQILDGARSEKMISYIVKRGGKFEEQEFKDMVMRYYFSRPEKKGVHEKLMKLKEEFEKDSSNLEDLHHYVFEIELIYKDMELMAEELVNKKRKGKNLLKKSEDKVHIGREKFMDESKRWKDPDFLFQEKLEKSFKKYGEKYGDENGALSESLISILAKKSVNKEFQDDSQQMFKHRKNMRNLLGGRDYKELEVVYTKEKEAFLSRAMAGLCTKRDTYTFKDEKFLQFNLFNRMDRVLEGNGQYNFSEQINFWYEKLEKGMYEKVDFVKPFQVMLARVNPKDTTLTDNEDVLAQELIRVAWEFVDANQDKGNKIQLFLPENTMWHALTTRKNYQFIQALQKFQDVKRNIIIQKPIELSDHHGVGAARKTEDLIKLISSAEQGVSMEDYQELEEKLNDKIFPCMRDPKV